MSIDLDMGIPYMPDDLPAEDRRREEMRRLLMLGGMMSGMGSYMGPGYPLMMDLLDDEEEKDPNP